MQVRGPQGSIEGEKSVSIEVKVEEDCEYYSEGDGCDYGGGDLTSPGGHPSLVTSAGRSSQAGMKVHHIALMKGNEEVVLDCHTEADIKAAPEGEIKFLCINRQINHHRVKATQKWPLAVSFFCPGIHYEHLLRLAYWWKIISS